MLRVRACVKGDDGEVWDWIHEGARVRLCFRVWVRGALLILTCFRVTRIDNPDRIKHNAVLVWSFRSTKYTHFNIYRAVMNVIYYKIQSNGGDSRRSIDQNSICLLYTVDRESYGIWHRINLMYRINTDRCTLLCNTISFNDIIQLIYRFKRLHFKMIDNTEYYLQRNQRL